MVVFVDSLEEQPHSTSQSQQPKQASAENECAYRVTVYVSHTPILSRIGSSNSRGGGNVAPFKGEVSPGLSSIRKDGGETTCIWYPLVLPGWDACPEFQGFHNLGLIPEGGAGELLFCNIEIMLQNSSGSILSP